MSDREEGHPITQAAISLGIAYCIWNVGRAIYHRPIVCAVIAAVFLVVCLLTGDSYIEVINMGCGFLAIGSVVLFLAYVVEHPVLAIMGMAMWMMLITRFSQWLNGIPWH